MYFELTDALVDSIINALDNQNQRFAVDASSSTLVEIFEDECDEDRFYIIPSWTSDDGFALMEQFVNSLHSPIARNDLLNVLRSGRGVFRGFKNVLKSYPEVEKKWHYFKNKQLIKYVNQWYNSLRETWGLEKLDCEIEETKDILQDDFTFLPYNYLEDRNELLEGLELIAKEYAQNLPKEIELALRDLWMSKLEDNFGKNACGFICRSVSKEFVGCATFAPCLENAPNTVILTSFFVHEKFRGLGIGRELLEMTLTKLKDLHFKWVVITNSIMPETITSLLLRSGFKSIGTGYIADLFSN